MLTSDYILGGNSYLSSQIHHFLSFFKDEGKMEMGMQVVGEAAYGWGIACSALEI